ncbi:MAG: alpha/beta hydrolase [Myxococcales bacterium]|nr:alpha/beta hydrolase [Myxococcales bacterium]
MMSYRTYDYYVRGMRLVWHEWGPPEGDVVLCFHGFLDHGRSYALMAECMSPSVRIVAPDVRGHGESDWVGSGGYYHFYDYYHDAQRLLVALGNPSEVVVVGHSMGGNIATGLSAMIPDRVKGLMLLEGLGLNETILSNTPERLRRWSQAQNHPELEGDVEARRQTRTLLTSIQAAAERLIRWNPRLSPERARRLAESATEPVDRGGRVWRYDPLHRTPAAKPFLLDEAKALWRGITAPTLSLSGGKGLCPERLDERHQAFPNVVVGRLPQAGHNLHHEQPEVLATILEDFKRTRQWSLPSGVLG